MTAHAPRLWILHLVPDVRFGRTLTGAVALALMLGVYAATGVFGAAPGRISLANAAVFFAVVIAYIVPTFHYIVARCEQAFAALAPHLDAAPAEIERWFFTIGRRDRGHQLRVVGLGCAAGFAHNLAVTRPTGLTTALASVGAGAVALGTILVWVFMTAAVFGLVDIARLFARVARHARVDLLQPRQLTPFARVAVISTLAVVGAQAAFPILWLQEGFASVQSLPGLVATVVPQLMLLAMPLVPIHRAIVAAKVAEITRLDALIGAIGGRAPVDLERLVPLLAYRREIQGVREWPFDTGVTGRLAFYAVIPPLTWVGAALIQHAVERAL